VLKGAYQGSCAGAAGDEVGCEDARTGEHDDRCIDAEDRDREGDPGTDDPSSPGADTGEPHRVARVGGLSHRREDRTDVGEQVWHADQVTQDPVAVHAHERHELIEQLDVRKDDEDEQGCVVSADEDGICDRDDDRVEVDATEIRPDPRPASKAVDVGEVGVEDRPDEVDANPHHARRRPTVASRGGVADLVESRRGEQQHGHEEQERRVDGQQSCRGSDAVVSRFRDRDVEGDEEAEHGGDHQGMEERSEGERHCAMGALWDETRSKPQGQERL
jgi:hypothetical protein